MSKAILIIKNYYTGNRLKLFKDKYDTNPEQLWIEITGNEFTKTFRMTKKQQERLVHTIQEFWMYRDKNV